MNGKAKYNSYGFRGKYWERGEIAENITEEELKRPDIKHFALSGELPKKEPQNQNCQDDSANETTATETENESPETLTEIGQRNQFDIFNKAQLREKLIAAGVEVTGNPNKETLVNLCIQNKIQAQ